MLKLIKKNMNSTQQKNDLVGKQEKKWKDIQCWWLGIPKIASIHAENYGLKGLTNYQLSILSHTRS
jgi:hypothetical protein